jgi:type I restriction enzyme S subunit
VPGAEIKSAKQAVQPDDVLLCKIVPHLNRVWVVGHKTDKRQIASGEWIVYRNHGCEPRYLRYSLTESSFRDQFMQTVAGVGGSLMRARPSEVADIEIGIAPLAEQRRIVAKIDSLTAKSGRARDQLDHIPRLVERYKQAVLAAAFQGKLTSDVARGEPIKIEILTSSRMALCSRLGVRPWKAQSEVPSDPLAAPDHWKLFHVGDLVAHRSGIAFESSDFVESGLQVVRLGNLYKGKLDLSRQPVFLKNIGKYGAFTALAGDLLVSQTGTKYKRDYGHFIQISSSDEPLLVNQRILRMTCVADINPKFLLLFSQTPAYRDHFFAHETGGVNQGNVGIAGVLNAPIALPPRNEQDQVVRRIEAAFAWIDRLASEATNARKLTDHLDQAVLAKAFRGELVPQDPNDEPATVLLERIRAERATPQRTTGSRGRPRRTA